MDRKELERVGATLRFIRETREVRQAELAKILHVSAPYLANVEAGRRRLTPRLARQACEALSVRPIVLVNSDFLDEVDGGEQERSRQDEH